MPDRLGGCFTKLKIVLLINNMLKKNLFLSAAILGFSFLSVDFCWASPLNLISPANGASDIEVDGYFQWSSGPAGTVKYVLDMPDQFTQSEDNIPPSVCSGGVCSFAFLDLSVGNINYLSAYVWRVTAYNIQGQPIDSSPDYTFTTGQPPAPPPDGDGDGDGGGDGSPIGLLNPLQCPTLACAIDAFINFLFLLAMAVAPILIVYAGFLILTAGGDATKIKKARQIILWTLVAVAVILFAKGFPALIKGALGG
jgi:hypothetical protein